MGGAVCHNLGCQYRADARQRFQLLGGGGVQIDGTGSADGGSGSFGAGRGRCGFGNRLRSVTHLHCLMIGVAAHIETGQEGRKQTGGQKQGKKERFFHGQQASRIDWNEKN